MSLPITLISGTHKLESGFRAISNENFESIIVDWELTSQGVLKLKSFGNGDLDINLADYYATKLYVQETLNVPSATESTAGKAKIATLEQAIEGDSDFTIVTPLKLLQKLEDYFSKASHLGDSTEELAIGNDISLTQILGTFGIKNIDGFLGKFLVPDNTADRNYTFPDRDIVVNDWDYIVGAPESYPPDAGFFLSEYGLIGVQNGINTVFQTLENFVLGSTRVYVNGVRQFRNSGKHYTETGANEITFVEPPEATDDIIIDYIKAT